MRLSAGTRLGPYEILSPLGAGGMGEVYRARDTRLSRELAIKVLPEALASNPERLRRFEKEAKAVSALNHPNIVTIHDIGSETGVSYIAMELVDGVTLRELLVSGPLATKRLLQIAPQIAEGLARAHEAGIVHRDLKPENVMLKKDGLVKILDFGLAKLSLTGAESDEGSQLPTMTGTEPGIVVGTVGYMSPEQASGTLIDFRSDQFSLGSILYEMATGRRAFQKKTAIDTLSAILNDEPEPIAATNPQAPAPLRWIVDRCLAKEPGARFASTQDLARDLASVRDHLSEVFSGSETMLATTTRPHRRLPALVLGLALLAAAVFAGWLARGRLGAAPEAPRFTRLTFRQGGIYNARFAPDGRTVVYGARWVGDPPGSRLYRTLIGSPESAKFDFEADILAISPSNELAILALPVGLPFGTLSRVPMSGGTPRQVLEDVVYAGADFSPDGKDLAVVHLVDGQRRLEYPIGKILLPRGANTPRVSRDGRSVAFTEVKGDYRAIAVVDRQGGAHRVLSDGWSAIEGAPCWSASGGEVWFAAPEQPGKPAALWAVNLSGKRRLLMRAPGSLELDDVSPGGRALLAHSSNTRVVRFASASEPGGRELSWLDGSWLVDLSSDGRTVLLNEVGEGSGEVEVAYLRGTDGSPAVKLGEGEGFALSPDGKWVLGQSLVPAGKPETLFLLPTGPGQERTLKGDFAAYFWGGWLPDGKSVVYSAEKEGTQHLYVQAVPDGEPRPIGPDRVGLLLFSNPVSPDGKYVIGVRLGEAHLVPLDGTGQSRVLPDLAPPGDRIVQWSQDSRHLYVFRRGEWPVRVWLYEVETGRRRLWKEIPFDNAGGGVDAGGGGVDVRVTPDGRAWAYGGGRTLAALYVVDGLH
jgi:Tol biopolymer transport system component